MQKDLTIQNNIRFLLKNITIIKYGLLIMLIFFMIFSIRTYIKHTIIEEEIKSVKQKTNKKIEEMNYEKNFVSNYMQSDYSKFFGKHENNIIFQNEYIIELKKMSTKKDTQTQNKNNLNNPKETIFDPLSNPEEARKHFLSEKLNKLKL